MSFYAHTVVYHCFYLSEEIYLQHIFALYIPDSQELRSRGVDIVSY
jgi:hypothetical protein